MKSASMKIAPGYWSALSRRHNGLKHTKEEILAQKTIMEVHYKIYLKYKAKLKHLLEVEWDEKEVEAHYGTNIFYNSHRKLGRYSNILDQKHRVLFNLLTHFDGNYNQSFHTGAVISVEEIMLDFKHKYLKEEL